jgi:hypothetical protein
MQDVPYGYCHCGCGRKTKVSPKTDGGHGYIKGKPRKWIPGHQNRRRPPHLVNPDTGCWEWQGSRNNKGYGQQWENGKFVFAHRWAYEQAKGPIPNGLSIDHLCGNRACVNPDHLEAVDHATNCRRGRQSKLTWGDVDRIRALEGVLTQYQIADQFGVTQSCIQRILTGGSWVR